MRRGNGGIRSRPEVHGPVDEVVDNIEPAERSRGVRCQTILGPDLIQLGGLLIDRARQAVPVPERSRSEISDSSVQDPRSLPSGSQCEVS